MIIVATINSSFLYTDLTGSLIMTRRFIPDVRNNVCTVDANGVTPQMKCSCAEECEYYCKRFNEDEKNDEHTKRNERSGNISEST